MDLWKAIMNFVKKALGKKEDKPKDKDKPKPK